ncbi:uncharacterized mitochondrial protein AtMg00810-like [Vicia villosa]|uniref:uncharacterized mitochondrial protein AtMg00810-like n=1 Tax=Vicia villosa TaxID=3911 RepID=UPI00273C25A6|nr:uncharacterized mitochondrial protein AtMg00810-like [Vicia villosa]
MVSGAISPPLTSASSSTSSGYVQSKGTDVKEIEHIKTLLDEKFSIKDLGVLKYFLGLEVARTKAGETISNPTAYRRLIGRLLYLTHSRPDIAYTVSKLSQSLDAPTNEHMLAGLHTLRYLKQCPRQGLFFSADSPLYLKGFSDSDWACPDTIRSTTSFCFFLGNSLISWKSKK